MKSKANDRLLSEAIIKHPRVQRDTLFKLYVAMLDPEMADTDQQMLDKAFPNEAELNLLQSTVKKVGKSEVLANNAHFIQWLRTFIEESNHMSISNMPASLRDAVQLLLCERAWLIQLIKGLLDRCLPKERPKFFNDSFLETQFLKLKNKQQQVTQHPLSSQRDDSTRNDLTVQSQID